MDDEIEEFLSVKAKEEVNEIEEFLLMGAKEDDNECRLMVPAMPVEVVDWPVASEVSIVGQLASWIGKWVKIGASAQVLAWVAQGVPIQLARAVRETRQAYHLEVEQKEWLIAEVEQSLHVGVIEWMGEGNEWPEGIDLACPVMCMPKKGPKQWCMVHDLCDLNLGLVPHSVWFEGLTMLVCLAGTNWWMITFNLMQGYHHLLMDNNTRRLLGFWVGQQWYCYWVLPFGLRWSPWIFMKVVKAMIMFWRWQGVMCMAYIDDFMVLALSKEELWWIRDQVIAPTLKRLGWLREPTKGEWEPTQHAKVLGLIVDLAGGRFEASLKKLHTIEAMVQEHRQWCHTKWQLAQLAGSINAISKAAPILQLYLRSTYWVMGCGWRDWNWRKPLTVEAWQDLEWIATNTQLVNGAPLWRPSRVMTIKTDASGYGWGAWVPESGEKVRGSFIGWEAEWPIHCKELQAIVLAIETFCPKFHNQWIEVASDNTTAVAYLHDGGGSDTKMTRMVKRVWAALHASGCALYTARWVHGVMENQEADALSQFIDADNWSLHGKTVELLWSVLGEWQVDWFVDADNWKAVAFNARFKSPGCQAVDAFAQDWRGWVNLLVPPIPLVGRVLAHLVECQAVGILVVPHWPGQEWWPLLQATLVLMVRLGMACEFAQPGPSGMFEPARWLEWTFKAHRVEGWRGRFWRPPLAVLKSWWD